MSRMALNGRQLRELRESSVSGTVNRVARAMQLAGVTQAQVGAAIGEPQPYISDIVRGRYQTITVAKAEKLAQYFGCAIEDLFPSKAERASA